MPEVGQPFNPFRLFTGIFIPEALVRSNLVSPGAKMAYGRLARYAGQDGRCFPAVSALAQEIGVGDRQAQKYLAELEKTKLIRRRTRFSGRAQTSNTIEFLWHPLFQEGVNDHSPGGVNVVHPKRVSLKRVILKRQTTQTVQPRIAKPAIRVWRLCRWRQPAKQYPRLREALAFYMVTGPEDEKVYPKPRHIVDVMDAAAGATEDEVLGCLSYLRDERGLKPGTRSGPRHFSWFPTVVGDYFLRQRERQRSSNPPSVPDVDFSQAQFDSMMDAIEI
jgi:hypothetical protein